MRARAKISCIQNYYRYNIDQQVLINAVIIIIWNWSLYFMIIKQMEEIVWCPQPKSEWNWVKFKLKNCRTDIFLESQKCWLRNQQPNHPCNHLKTSSPDYVICGRTLNNLGYLRTIKGPSTKDVRQMGRGWFWNFGHSRTEGGGVVCESSDVRTFLKKSNFQNFSELFKLKL